MNQPLSPKFKSLARWLILTSCVLSSIYALLCYIPTSWIHLISVEAYPGWVKTYIKYHPLLTAILFLPAAISLRGIYRWGSIGLIISTSVALSICPFMTRLGNNKTSFLISLLWWLPYFLWETVLWISQPEGPSWPEQNSVSCSRYGELVVKTALVNALFQSSVFFGSYIFWHGLEGASFWASLGAFGWMALTHALLFMVPAALLLACRYGAQIRTSAGGLNEFFLLYLCGLTALSIIFKFVIFSSLTYVKPLAWVNSIVISLGLITALVKDHLDQMPARSSEFQSTPIEMFMGPLFRFFRFLKQQTWRLLPALLILAVLPLASRLALGGFDWNRLIESLAALLIWSLGFVFFYALFLQSPTTKRSFLFSPWILTPALIIGAWGFHQLTLTAQARMTLQGIPLQETLKKIEETEISLKTSRRLLKNFSSTSSIYQFLQTSTNLSRQTKTLAPNIILAHQAPTTKKIPPSIIMITIDSLRRDYLGAYNNKVSFTPHLDAFARESLVFQNTLTPYGGTGLSEPSIWTGSRMIHKHYVEPFGPINSLEKLLEQTDLQRFITLDVVLKPILKPSTATIELNANESGNYKFCRTVDELTSMLKNRSDQTKPIFVYTQPQDVHISAITKENNTVPESGNYEGFHAPYASRVQILDRCFGRLMSTLHELNLYDESIIIFTADHGDSLGEGGRWGHAYTIFPEILRVPLIMRVPQKILTGYHYDLDDPAFLTDITPTLYSLLGYSSFTVNGIYGRPLISNSSDTLKSSLQEEHLIVSSYGPVYGILAQNTRWLYIADGVNFKNYLYDLKKDPKGENNLVSPDADQKYQESLLWHVKKINELYGFHP